MPITRGKFKYQLLQLCFLFSSSYKILCIDKIHHVSIGFELHQVLCGMRWSKNKYFHFKFIPPIHSITVFARLTEWTGLFVTRCRVKQATPPRSHRLRLCLLLLLKSGWLLRIQKVGYKMWGAEDLVFEGWIKKKPNDCWAVTICQTLRCVFTCYINASLP